MTKANDSFKHYIGTDNYFKDLMQGGCYTDGVRGLANYCEAYWLIDLIFSHQTNEKVKEEHFQAWELKRQSDNVFNIIFTDGNQVTSQQNPSVISSLI